MREYIIDDSSRHTQSLINKEYSIRVGIVREHIYLVGPGQTRYIVEVWKDNKLYPMTCMRTSRFGGLYNYEEFNHRGFTAGKDNAGLGNFAIVSGDMVLVAAVNGESREGIIIGSINHFGRDEILPATGEQAYVSEFNGIQTAINKDGEYRRMFKGTPKNIKKLDVAPNGERYPDPEYDIDVGFSYYEFDKTGSYSLTDNANDDLAQSIKIDKPNGKIIITSGKTVLTIDKKEESYSIINKKVTFDTTDEFNLNTKKTNIKSTDEFSLEAAAIKTKGEITQTGNAEVKGNIKQTGNTEVKGNFKTSGQTSLGGGANALVYDIVLTIGTGNLGAPVISNHVFLKTVNTKAT